MEQRPTKRKHIWVIIINKKKTYKKSRIIKKNIWEKYVYMQKRYNLIADAYGEKRHIEKKHIQRRNIH